MWHEQSIIAFKREETRRKQNSFSVLLHIHTHTHTPESPNRVSYVIIWKNGSRERFLKLQSMILILIPLFTPTQPSVRPMRRGLLLQGWYWVLVFLVITLTARPVPGCCTWFQVGVMWPLCSSCSKRTCYRIYRSGGLHGNHPFMLLHTDSCGLQASLLLL